MKQRIHLYLLIGSLMMTFSLCAQQPPIQTPVQLPDGWYLTPAGTSLPLSSDLPLNIALAPDGIHAAVTNNGNGIQTIDLINLRERKLTASVTIGKAWLGLAFAKKRPYLYASGGNDDIIIRYTLQGEKLFNKDTLTLGGPWPAEKISPTGLALDEEHDRLYVVTKEDKALYVCDTRTMTVLKKLLLFAEAYTCLLNPVKPELYISAWGGRKIWIYNTSTNALTDSIYTGDHPNDMAISRNGKWLFVANANANSVSVIQVFTRKVTETLQTALSPEAPIGSTTNSVALGAGDKTLYVANADNNYLAVFEVSDPGNSHSEGYIPVGWYPTCVRVWNNQLLVADGKGLSSMANPYGPNPYEHVSNHKKADTAQHALQYIGSMFKGCLSLIPAPGPASLARYTKQVYANTPYSAGVERLASGETGNPIPRRPGDHSPIRYIFYVLKENRTYDQVLGDMPEGNGDSSLCLFGSKVTPNAHALSRQFVLLDNFYVNAEVSADGHNWSMAGYATDFTEKTWPSNYSGRGGEYDFDGSRPVANPTKGFIWDYCDRAGISFRNYGEFMDSGNPTLPILRVPGNYCPAYPPWDLNIQDCYREPFFERDFDSLVQAGSVPRFNTIYLPNDHTSGMSNGKYTPIAHVADNDLALGRLVDHISHSPIWKESAIFVLEDDAQDGPDHVDAHRSVAYVISPYIKHGTVNHTLYSTVSMLRTMELILGIPPMSQYDAAATPMWSCFGAVPNTMPYSCHPAQTDINDRNKALTRSAVLSNRFDLSKADAIPDRILNEVIWKSVKGENSTMPAPIRSAFVKVADKKQENE